MNILIIDGNRQYAKHLSESLSALGYVVIDTPPTTIEIADVLSQNQIDLVLIDLLFEGDKKGFDLIEQFKQMGIAIVLTSENHTWELYQKILAINQFPYLVKPVHVYTIDSVIRLMSHVTPQENQFIRSTAQGEIIAVRDIVFIKVELAYTSIQTLSRRYVYKKSLSSLKNQIPLAQFVQIHRSYYVQKKFINKIDTEKNLVEVDGYSLPLSRRMKGKLQIVNGILLSND